MKQKEKGRGGRKEAEEEVEHGGSAGQAVEPLRRIIFSRS